MVKSQISHRSCSRSSGISLFIFRSIVIALVKSKRYTKSTVKILLIAFVKIGYKEKKNFGESKVRESQYPKLKVISTKILHGIRQGFVMFTFLQLLLTAYAPIRGPLKAGRAKPLCMSAVVSKDIFQFPLNRCREKVSLFEN